MPDGWTPSIREHGQLRVALRHQRLTGDWAQVFVEAVDQFNSISRARQLGVQFLISSDRPHVEVSDANGPVTVIHSRLDAPSDVIGRIRDFSGSALRGSTFLIPGHGGIVYGYIFVPRAPMILGLSRPAGRPVRLVIAFHELIHATGLRNRDHSGRGIFSLALSPAPGATPGEDRLTCGVPPSHDTFPPLTIDAETVRRIANLWSVPLTPTTADAQ